jgi:hypothetical protein
VSDLIERLRGLNEYRQRSPLYNEAADEIEKLRKSNHQFECLNCDLQREIKRLAADRDEWERLWKKASIGVFALQARVEMLEGVYKAAHEAAMFCVRDGYGKAHIVPRYMQPLDDALNRAATEQENE